MSKNENQELTKESMLIREFLQNKDISQENFNFLVSYLTGAVAAELSSVIQEEILKILKPSKDIK